MYGLDQTFQAAEHQPFLWTQSDAQAAALLVHGFPGTPADVRPIADMLFAAGWAVQAVLLPGFGSQIATLGQRQSVEWIEAVRRALADLKRSYPSVLLVGYSLGGALAVQVAAVERPAALLLLAPFWKLEHPLWPMLPVIRRVLPAVPIFRLLRLDFSDPETRASILNFVPDADLDDPQTQQAIRDFRLPVSLFAEVRKAGVMGFRAAPQVRVPVTIIQGVQDELVRPYLTAQLVRRFPNGARLLEVQADHVLIDPRTLAWAKIREVLLDFRGLATTGNVG
ncbi:MAG: alpha/beta fold hydrolase [Anaerolineae bacterium]|nr:alpha/beta fold hydrolase [Anaerolineae bacterium]